jgi:hypothetical protein
MKGVPGSTTQFFSSATYFAATGAVYNGFKMLSLGNDRLNIDYAYYFPKTD